ncbi:MAG: inosine/xanthosine triphosphatase [Woeseiaceae bacterium]|nr:inosine/xanthosine triphosphatase [Woeseiaceae bacterium]
MRVIVASENPVKVAATRDAFTTLFPEEDIEIIALNVASGVADQPVSDAETRQGAANRAGNARTELPDADFWVGLEGGIEVIDDQLTAFAWMHVCGRNGFASQARTPSLPLPPGVKALVDEGLELGEANDRVFSTLNSKQGGGAFGLLTGGRLTRESVYAQTVLLALMPFANELYPHSAV